MGGNNTIRVYQNTVTKKATINKNFTLGGIRIHATLNTYAFSFIIIHRLIFGYFYIYKEKESCIFGLSITHDEDTTYTTCSLIINYKTTLIYNLYNKFQVNILTRKIKKSPH